MPNSLIEMWLCGSDANNTAVCLIEPNSDRENV